MSTSGFSDGTKAVYKNATGPAMSVILLSVGWDQSVGVFYSVVVTSGASTST